MMRSSSVGASRFRGRRRALAAIPFAVGSVVLAASAPGCDVKSDANMPEAGPPECPGCPPDPKRDSVAQCDIANSVDTIPIESFDNHQISTGTLGAQALYTYTDGTAQLDVETYDRHAIQVGQDSTGAGYSGFEPPVAPGSPCGPQGDASFFPGHLHVFAGPFRAWGGGVGVSMQKLNGRELIPGNTDQHPNDDPNAPKNWCCWNGGMARSSSMNVEPATPPQCTPHPDPKLAAACPGPNAEFAVSVAALDVSQYEGLSFWARRGPTSQIGMRVLVGDKYTDDDLNYLAQRHEAYTGVSQPLYCQRIRECDCRIGQTCSYFGADQVPATEPPGYYCQKPTSVQLIGGSGPNCAQPGVPGLGGAASAGSQPINGQGPSNCCDVTGCAQTYPAFPTDLLPNTGRFAANGLAGQPGDPQFFGKPCTPYAWPNGVGGSWCWDPATDAPPPASTELCGDHWTATVDLTLDWQFFMVPFTIMHQQGWAKRSEQLDLSSVSTIRFSWDAGYIDYWIDDVSFYRHKNQ